MKLERHDTDCFNLIDNDRVIGRVHLLPTGNGWYLSRFLILRRFREQGFGHQLMTCILRLAKRRRKKSIFLWVAASNTAALRIYEAAGFQCRIDDGGWRFYTLILTPKNLSQR